jgi:hypothetical protein
MSSPGTHPLAPRPAGWYPDPAGKGGQRWHDGQGWTGSVTFGRTRRPLSHGFAIMSDWLGRLLFLTGVVLLAMTFMAAWDWTDPVGMARREQLLARGQVDGFMVAQVSALVLFGLLYLLTGVIWLIWQYRLAMQAPVPLRHSPGWHVGAWLVPMMRLWRPRLDIGDIWRAYHRRGEPEKPTPWSFSLWWMCWLAPLLSTICYVLLVLLVVGQQQAAPDFQGIWVLTLVGFTAGAFMARLVVRDLSWRALLYWSDAG